MPLAASPPICWWLHLQLMLKAQDRLFLDWPPDTELWPLQKVQAGQRGFPRLIEQEIAQKKKSKLVVTPEMVYLVHCLAHRLRRKFLKMTATQPPTSAKDDHCHPRIKTWLFSSKQDDYSNQNTRISCSHGASIKRVLSWENRCVCTWRKQPGVWKWLSSWWKRRLKLCQAKGIFSPNYAKVLISLIL